MHNIKRLLSLVLIAALVFPDLARAMEDGDDGNHHITRALILPPPQEPEQPEDSLNPSTVSTATVTTSDPGQPLFSLSPPTSPFSSSPPDEKGSSSSSSLSSSDNLTSVSPPASISPTSGSSSLSSSPTKEDPHKTTAQLSNSESSPGSSPPDSSVVVGSLQKTGVPLATLRKELLKAASAVGDQKEQPGPPVPERGLGINGSSEDVLFSASPPGSPKETDPLLGKKKSGKKESKKEQEEVVVSLRDSGDSSGLSDSSSEQNRLTPADVKQAWKGDKTQQARVRQLVESLQHVTPQEARDLVQALLQKTPIGKDKSVNIAELSDEKLGSALQEWTWLDPEQDLGGAPLRVAQLPEGWEFDPLKLRKIKAFLEYLEPYTFQNKNTWKQYLAMATAMTLGGLAAWPMVPIFNVGLYDIVDERLGWYPLTNSVTFEVALQIYVCATALFDNVPRMSWCARRACAPSTKAFSAPRNKLKDYLTYGLYVVSGSPIVLTMLYYLVDAEEQFVHNAEQWGVDPTPYKVFPYKWGGFLMFETFVWSLDQFHNFKGWVAERFFSDSVPRGITHEYVPFRRGLLKKLNTLQEAFNWMPNEQIRHIYGEFYKKELLDDMKAQNPDGTQSQRESMMAYCRLNYLLALAGQVEEDHIQAKSHYKAITEWISAMSALSASVARVIAMQLVFSAMIKWISFDKVSEDAAEKWGWGLSAALGLIGQGVAEVTGGIDFFHRYVPSTGLVQKTEPENETAFRAVRYPAIWYTALESVWNLIPLVALCLDSVDKFFGGKYIWMLLFSTYIANEYFGGAATLTESYVRSIPTNANRLWNHMRRLCGYEYSTGYMRDELSLMVERFRNIIENTDLDTLVFIKQNMGEGKLGESLSSSTSSSPTSSRSPLVISPEDLTSEDEEEEENLGFSSTCQLKGETRVSPLETEV